MAILLHVTPRRNLPSIRQRGIDPAFSRSQWPVCWFCAGRRRAWAIAHVAERYGVPASEVAVLRVNIPRRLLTHRGRASWTCERVVREILSVAVPAAPLAPSAA